MSQIQKINKLNDEAWSIRVKDSERALNVSSEAFELSRAENYIPGLAQSLRIIGFCQIRQGQHLLAKNSLDQANDLYVQLGDEKGLASVYEYMGILDRIRGDLRLSIDHINAALDLSRKTNFTENEITNLYQLGVTYRSLGNFDKALDYLFECLSLSRSFQDELMEGYALNVIGSIYYQTNEYSKSLEYYQQGLKLRRKSGDKWGEAGSLDNIGTVMIKLKDWEQAKRYCTESLELCDQIQDLKGKSNTLIHLAEINIYTNNWEEAAKQGRESLAIREQGQNKKGQVEALLFLSQLIKLNPSKNKENEIAQHLQNALKNAEEINSPRLIAQVHYSLYEHYKSLNNFDKSLFHLEKNIEAESDHNKFEVDQKILNLEISHHAQEVEKEAEIYRLKNVELAELNKKIAAQKETVESTLQELLATQKQLIQSEKMASLGELTAGIAHEIQNPLNFVNNFSDINSELLKELSEALSENNFEEAIELIQDIRTNEEKIKEHGARADSIVKGMLQHSRSSTGEKIATEINSLAEEYLRLSYHGLRAKDSSFNTNIATSFDPSVKKIKIVPQDIGRVFLNILNNAFYAVHEKFRQSSSEYQPKVCLSTEMNTNSITITIEDNGNGMPEALINKIFQPFFTTKPTGQGTGLGLSLSYDIIKAHDGQILVESTPGNGTKFQIILPK